MSLHRVTLEFDLHLDDEEAARKLADELIRRQVAETEAEGVGVVTSSGSPEVASYGLAQELRVAASLIAVEFLKKGTGGMPDWVAVASLRASNEQIS